MGGVLTAIALTPSAPVLVPELAGTADAEVAGFRDAAVAAAARLPDRWIAVGVGAADAVIEPSTMGTFAGYGVDVPVALAPEPPGRRHLAPDPPGRRHLAPDPPVEVSALPLCALFTGWLRGRANPAARAQVRVYSAGHDAEEALALGRALRAELDGLADPVGVLMVADGANTLTPPAPGGYDPDAEPVQAALDDALATGDTAALAALPDFVVGRVAYQVLAGLAGSGPRSAKELARGAPYGVGYFVGVWTP